MNVKQGLSVGIVLCALAVAACSQAGTATPGPTTATGTVAPGTEAPAVTPPATSPPAATPSPTAEPSMGASTAAFAVFEPKAGATPAVQGGATLVALDGQTQVVIGVESSTGDEMAATIQAGTCDNLTPEAAYRLTNIVSGASATIVDVDLATLLASPFAVNIVVAGSETESSITCGEIQPLPAS